MQFLEPRRKVFDKGPKKVFSMSENDLKFFRLLQNFILPPNNPRDIKDAVVTNPSKFFRQKDGNFFAQCPRTIEKNENFFEKSLILQKVSMDT